MTTIDEARQIIYKEFVDNFTGTPNYVFDNKDSPFEESSVSEWVRFIVRSSTRNLDSFGGDTVNGFLKNRTLARIIATCFVKTNTGGKKSDIILGEIKNIFQQKNISGLSFRVAEFRDIGVSGRWFMKEVDILFEFYERV